MKLFFPESPRQGRHFGTIRPTKFQNVICTCNVAVYSCLKMTAPLVEAVSDKTPRGSATWKVTLVASQHTPAMNEWCNK